MMNSKQRRVECYGSNGLKSVVEAAVGFGTNFPWFKDTCSRLVTLRTMKDICISLSHYVFNYRVGAIIKHQERVLVNQLAGQDFWFLPGGRVTEGEMSGVALEREVQEELASPCQIIRPVFLAEAAFALESKKFHELCLYYLVELPSDSPL